MTERMSTWPSHWCRISKRYLTSRCFLSSNTMRRELNSFDIWEKDSVLLVSGLEGFIWHYFEVRGQLLTLASSASFSQFYKAVHYNSRKERTEWHSLFLVTMWLVLPRDHHQWSDWSRWALVIFSMINMDNQENHWCYWKRNCISSGPCLQQQ